MAGSWKHFVDDNGRFDGSRMLENGGDVVEALEECYGMVWLLASQLTTHTTSSHPEYLEELPKVVEAARKNYRQGLAISPGFTERAAEQNINWDGAWGHHTAQPNTEEDE